MMVQVLEEDRKTLRSNSDIAKTSVHEILHSLNLIHIKPDETLQGLNPDQIMQRFSPVILDIWTSNKPNIMWSNGDEAYKNKVVPLQQEVMSRQVKKDTEPEKK